MLTSFLDVIDYLADTAENGQAAIEKLSAKDYDFIITDIEMPRAFIHGCHF